MKTIIVIVALGILIGCNNPTGYQSDREKYNYEHTHEDSEIIIETLLPPPPEIPLRR